MIRLFDLLAIIDDSTEISVYSHEDKETYYFLGVKKDYNPSYRDIEKALVASMYTSNYDRRVTIAVIDYMQKEENDHE